MNYRSIADLNRAIVRHMHRLPASIDLLVGIPRSGLLAANILALHMNRPLADLDGFLRGHVLGAGQYRRRADHAVAAAECRKVLILDDSLWSGREMERARHRVAEAGITTEVIYGCVYCNPDQTTTVDFYFETCPIPRIFEWNLMHHDLLEQSCMDIDGILCPDPTEEENDDGCGYEEFLLTTPPLFMPTKPVGWLVTARLEKYRSLTERWLAQHGLQYRQLLMLDLPSKNARLKAGSHGAFKATIYDQTASVLFIESSGAQAVEIARRTGKPVFCAETRQLITLPKEATTRNLPTWLRRKARGALRRIKRKVTPTPPPPPTPKD